MADIVINPAIGKIDFFTTKGESVTNTLRLTGNTLLVTGPLSASSISTGGGGAFVTSVQPTTNYLSKFTGNSTIANSVIYDNGTNVGIGTTSPAYKLDVNGILGISGTFFADKSTNYFRILEPAGNVAIYLGNAADPTNYYDNTGHTFRNRGGSSVYAYINSNGNLGIGTTSPGAPLTIYRASNPWIRVNGGGAFSYIQLDDGTSYGYLLKNSSSDTSNNALAGALYTYTDSGKAFQHIHSGTALFTILSGGSIGIGSTAPSYKLEVYSGAKTSAFTGLSISNFNNYDGTAASLVTSQLRFAILENPTGTYNAPARTFTILESGNEANNSSSDGFFAISTRSGGTVAEKLRLNSAGNLGIGTTNPTTKLAISDGTTIAQVNPSSGVAYFGSVNNYPVALSVNSSEKVRIISDGNVGIGTTSIPSPLTVYSNGDVWHFRLGSATGELRFGGQTSSGAVIQSYTPGGVVRDLYIQRDGGNIGVGTNAATARLHLVAPGNDGAPVLRIVASGSDTFNWASSTMYANLTADETAIHLIGKAQSQYNSAYLGFRHVADGSSSNMLSLGLYSADYLVNILGNGSVGIGTISPNSKLDIRNGNLELSDSAFSNIPEIRFTGNSSGRYVFAGIKADEDGQFNGHLEFWTTPVSANSTAANAAFTERMRITSAGNVGIGTTSPAYKLHVVGDGYVTGNLTVGLTSNWSNINFIRSGGSTVGGFGWRSDGYFYVAGHPDYGPGAGNDVRVRGFGANLILGTNSTDYIWLNTSGNLGIGTNNPATKLQVIGGVEFGYGSNSIFYTGTAFDASNYLILQNNTDAYGRVGLTINAKTFSAANTPSTNDGWALDPRSGIRFRGWLSGDSGYDTKFVIQHLLANATNAVGDLGIFAKGYSSTVPAFVLAGGGNVGIGTTSPAYKLDVVSGSIRASSGAYAGELYFGTNSNADLYLKRDNGYDLSLVQNASSGNALYLAGAGNVYLSIDSNNNETDRAFIVQNNSIKSGTELFRVNEAGSVGIGTSSPGYKLDVGAVGSNSVSVRLTPGYERVRYYGFDLLGYNDGNLWMIGNNATNALILGSNWDWDSQIAIAYTPGTFGAGGGTLELGQVTKNNANFTHGNTRFYTNGIERLRIISSGNVGVGTTSPTAKFQVGTHSTGDAGNGDNSANVRIGAASAGARVFGMTLANTAAATLSNESALSFVLAGNYSATGIISALLRSTGNAATDLIFTNYNGSLQERMRILYDGNVGIGTSVPAYKLDVSGTGFASSDFRAPIFYDSANTTYYVDPASTSNLVGLTVANTITGNITGNAGGNAAGSSTFVASLGSNINYDSGSRLTKRAGLSHYSGYSTGTNRPTTFDYTLQVTDGNKGWEISMDWIATTGPAIYARSLRDCCQNWSTWVRILDSANYAYAANMNQNVRTTDNVTHNIVDATQFRDSANTAYYVDPASTSNLSILSLVSYAYINGQTLNGQSFYQWDGATYRNPGDHTPQLLIRKDNSSTGINGFAPALALYNNNGADQTTVGMTFVSAEAVSPTQGNSVELAGIIAKKESTGTVNGWSRGSLNFYTKDFGTRKDVMYMSPDGTVTVTGTDNNSGKADFSVDTGGTATMALSGQYFRVGSTDVNWAMKIQNDGYIATWAQQMRFSTDSGDNAITFATNSTNRVNIGGSTTETVKITGYANYVGNYGYNTLTLIDTSGYPGLNYRSGNNNWLMRMDGGGTYSMNWSSNASAKDVGTFSTPFYFGTGGTAYASNDFRAPIFYDANDTSYYVDPNGTTNLLTLSVNRINNLRPYVDTWHTSTDGTRRFYFANVGTTYYSTGNNFVFRNSSDVGVVTIDGSGNLRTSTSGDNYASYSLHVGGTGFASADFRAPIFYDSSNTGYYLDPASTTTSLQIAGAIEQGNDLARPLVQWGASGDTTGMIVIKLPGTSSNYGMIHAVIDIYEYSGANVSTIIVGGHNWNGYWYNYGSNVVGYTNKTVRLGFKDGQYCIVLGGAASVWSYGQVVLRKIQNGAYYTNNMDLGGTYSISQTATESFTWVTGDLTQLRTPGTFIAYGDIRAPIFYDSDNTGYYLNPASTSNLNVVNLVGITGAGAAYIQSTTTGTSYSNHIQIRESSGGGGNTSEIYAPALGFHWSGVVASNILMESSGRIAIRNNPGSGYENFIANAIYGAVFYDSNDTGYYCDPNGNSVLNGLYVNAYYNLVNDFKDVYVYGDANTYYVVLIQGEYIYSYGRYSVTRGYNWTAPDTWYISTHKGGLTLDWEWSGDTAWGGNDHAIRIIEFNETYSNMVAGMGYPVNGGIIIWLRGGGVNGALYRIRTPIGTNSTITIYDGVNATNHSTSTSFTAANSAVFSTRSDTSNVNSEINARYPVRGAASLYNEGSAVIDQSGTSQSKSGILSSAASFRAPVFYDSADTGYFVDPNGTSNLYYITMPYLGNGTPNLLVNNGGSENWSAIKVSGGNDQNGIGYSNTGHSAFGRNNFSFHVHSSDAVRFHSSGWDTLFEVAGSSGNAWLKGGLFDSGFTRLVNPGGAYYVTSTSSVTGAIKIRLPRWKVTTMMRMTVKIYQYNTGYCTTIECGGYDYSNAEWYNVFAYQNGDLFGNITVRFGNDGTYDCIWIGETTDTWSYPQVFVTDFQAGFSNYGADWGTGWNISYVTSFGTVSTSRVAYKTLNTNSTLTAGNLSGTIPSAVLGNSTVYVGTTAIALNRTSSSQTLTGISIDGNAATATVNSGNTSAAWYPIVWHSGNTHYSTANVQIYAAGGYIQANYFNSSDNDETNITRFIIKNGDNYHRSATTTSAANIIRGVASGDWSINAVNLSTTRANWSTNGTITAVVGQLCWKNYGNGHTIIDASNSTSPAGGAINNTNPDVAWTGTYPTLMGWNGANTYGVRVDSCRYADQVGYSPSRTDSTAYPVLWGSGTSYTVAYSCAAVTIQSSTGTLNATNVNVSGKLVQNSTTQSITGTGQTLTLNVAAAAVQVISMASGATITTISYTNRDNNPSVNTIMLVVKYAGSASITFTNVLWANGTAPTLTGTSGYADVFMLTSYQGGAGTPVWIGTVVAQALVSTNL